jgi:MFS family permease
MLPSTLAWQLNAVASGYAAFVLSDSATTLGIVSIASGLPVLALSLVGGVVADRFPRRTVLLLAQSTFAVATGAVAAAALAGRLQVWHLVALGLVQGVAMSFNIPARQAYIAELVGPHLLRNAVALNNAGMNGCRIVGPALAGALLAMPVIGIGGVFGLMTAMYAAVLLSLLQLPARSAADEKAERPASGGWEQLVEGLAYIRGSPVLLALMGLACVPLLFGLPYLTLLPLFAERVFDVGAAGLGALSAAAGIGGLAGSLTVATISNHSRPAALQLGFGVGFGLALIAFGFAPAFPVAIVALAIAGFTSAAYGSLNNTLVMGNTEPRLFGRVMSVYLMTYAVMPIASFPAAWLADHIGGPATVAGGGLVIVAAVVGVAALYPPYRHIR